MTTAARSYRWLFWTLAVLGLAIDQTSKYGMFRELYNDGNGGQLVLFKGDRFCFERTSSAREEVVDAVSLHVSPFGEVDGRQDLLRPLRIWGGERMPTVNQGALFGIGQNMNIVFAGVSIFAAAVVLYWQSRAQSGRDPYLCIALGLILAGTLGNLYDRIVFDGVRDFLHWNKWFNWYVFNIADVCLVAGASMLVLEALFANPKSQPSGGDATYADAPPAAVPAGGSAVQGVAVTTSAE
jgi:signal peptidase II